MFLNKLFNLFKYSMHIPHFIRNNERQEERARDGVGVGVGVDSLDGVSESS